VNPQLKDLASRFIFTIGENDSADLSQFPDVENMGGLGLDTERDGFVPGHELGFALGLAYLKLCRPWPRIENPVLNIDPVYLLNLLPGMQRSSPEILEGFLAVIETLTDVSLNRPDLIPALIARVDALTNADLRTLCIDALRFTKCASMFFWGLDGTGDGK
jgi:hypothetical protein